MATSTTESKSLSPSLAPWPPKDSLSTHIMPRSSTINSFGSQILIAAPASLVFSIIRDISSYPSWNSFTPNCHLRGPQSSKEPNPNDTNANTDADIAHAGQILDLNTQFSFDVVMDPSKPTSYTPTQLRITDISTPEHPSTRIPQDVLDTDGSFSADVHRTYRICWTTEGWLVTKGLRSERFSEVIVCDGPESNTSGNNDGSQEGQDKATKDRQAEEEGEYCVYRSWECQGGVLARIVKWKFRDVLLERFKVNAEDLKKEAERRWKEQKAAAS